MTGSLRINQCSFFVFFSRPGGIPARNHKGERLLLFLGIIDILQSYRMRKKLEHTLKSIILDGVSKSKSGIIMGLFNLLFQDTVSVHRPRFYAHRFLDFMADRVFKKIPSRECLAIKLCLSVSASYSSFPPLY